MFDILMYLFDNYINQNSQNIDMIINQNTLTDELLQAGFEEDEIMQAMSWLAKLSDLKELDKKRALVLSDPGSIRIFTDEENTKLDVNCRGFILFLEQLKVLEPTTREIVLDRVMELDLDEVGLDDLKWVVLMVLFNIPGKEKAYNQLEDLIFNSQEHKIH